MPRFASAPVPRPCSPARFLKVEVDHPRGVGRGRPIAPDTSLSRNWEKGHIMTEPRTPQPRIQPAPGRAPLHPAAARPQSVPTHAPTAAPRPNAGVEPVELEPVELEPVELEPSEDELAPVSLVE